MKYVEIIKGVKADRIDSAIAAAAELYLERGIDEVKMTDIADRSQLGVASLYRYFGTKQSFTVRVASYIWKEQMRLYEGVYESDYYHDKTGIEQIEELLKIFNVLLQGQSRFLRFVSDFDAYVVREGIKPEELAEYEYNVLNAKPLMEAALEKGIADGTVRSGVDAKLYYFTVTHSLMAMCQKFAAGRILDSDDPDGSGEEVLMAIEMYVSFVRAR